MPCDPQTYEHIKMQASVDDDNLDNDYLIYTRNFILDEVEADIVCLQNKTIGKNHKLDPTYKYKAWYKAYDQILIGNHVTPKTDPGDYIIEKTGVIDVHAGNSITLSPGFHSQSGSDFHAFIYYDGCTRPRGN
ncbi:MAG: 3-coathanger stack domain-containing protein [Crocinitomicaceae bacterium]